MSRPKFEPTEYMKTLLRELAKLKGIPLSTMNREFLTTLETLIKAGSLDFGYGILFKTARQNLPGDVYGISNFDVTLLETAKSKSGFVGVYTQGNRWRAQVPDPARGGIPKQLSLRDTPVEAAIDRFKWYEEHALPYGNIGWHIDYWRGLRPLESMEEIFSGLVQDARDGAVGGKRPYTLDELQRFIKRWHEKNPKQEPAFAGSSMPRSTTIDANVEEPPTEVICSICSKPIERDYELRFYKETEWRHRNCNEPQPDN